MFRPDTEAHIRDLLPTPQGQGRATVSVRPAAAGPPPQLPMNAQRRTIVLAIAAGPLRYGVAALLDALPGVERVELAGDCESAIARVAALRPAIALVDGALPGMGAPQLVARLRSEWPATRCLALADDVRQHRRLAGAGAETVLLKGAPPARLAEAVQGMLV